MPWLCGAGSPMSIAYSISFWLTVILDRHILARLQGDGGVLSPSLAARFRWGDDVVFQFVSLEWQPSLWTDCHAFTVWFYSSRH